VFDLHYYYDILVYMIIKALIALIILIGGYFIFFHMGGYKPMTGHIPQEQPTNKANFIPSNTFAGAKKGYVFKMDSKGLGYYLDQSL